MNALNLTRPAAMMLANVPLRGVLIAAFTALVIGAVGTVGTLAYHAGQQAVTILARQLLDEVGERINQRLSSYFSGPEYVVQSNAALIRQGQLDWRDTAALARHFAGQLRLLTGVTGIGLVTENREFLSVVQPSPDALILRRFDAATGYRLNRYQADQDGQPGELIESRQNFDPHNDPPGNPWYPAAREAGRGGWRLVVTLGKGQDHPALIIIHHLPFHDASGSLQGVLTATMFLTGIGEFLQSLNVSPSGQAFLIDRQGLLVATSTGEIPFDSRARTDHPQNVAVESRRLAAVDSVNPLTSQTVWQLLAREPVLDQLAAPLSLEFTFHGQRYFAEVAPLVQDMSHPDWITVVVAPEGDFTALITPYLQQPILLAGLALVTAILLGLLAAGGISRPLQRLQAATRRLAEGDFSQPIPPAPIRELQNLGESFDKMTRRLREAFADLHAAQQELADDNQRLERRVEERTAELVAEQRRVVKAMAQVAESEAKFRGMFEQSPLGVVLIDARSGRLLEVNEHLAQLLGRTREELVKINWTAVTHPDDLPAEQNSVARLHAGEITGFELDKRYLRPDGSVVWAHLTVTTVTMGAEGNPLHLGLVEDISARKAAEAALIEAKQRAERLERAKSEFLANMSHEIRTPMNAVLGLAQLLEKEPLAPDQHDMVRQLRAAGRSLLGILNDILDFSKIESGQIRIEAQPFALTPLLEHLENLQGNLARAKGLTFRIAAPTGVTGGLVGDALRLEQILLNLISNAIKFTAQGEVRVQVQPAELTETTARLRFEVRDTGVGIAPEALATLFEPFTQADGSITRRFGGTGLGLSISKRLVELMGGAIGAESTPDVGSTFWFELPFARTTTVAPAPVPGAPAVAPAGPRLAGRRVLVVDDSRLNRTLVARALAREGAEVTLAEDGQQALAALRTARFDAVLMDVQMPVMDGLSATRALRSELGLTELPVIAFTAGVLAEEQQRALAAGVNDFLGKPVDLEDMATLLRRWTCPPATAANVPALVPTAADGQDA